MKDKVPISIIVPAFKAQQFIEECLKSIEEQSYFINNDQYEVLIGVDGCKETLEKVVAVESIYSNVRVVVMGENNGAFITLNTLLDKAKYENILRFDADDIMKPNLISDVVGYLDDYDVVVFNHENISEKAKDKINTSLFPSYGTALFKKRVFDILGGYQPWRCIADEELFGRIERSKKITVGWVDDALFYRRVHSGCLSFSSNYGVGSEERRKLIPLIGKRKRKVKRVTGEYMEDVKDILCEWDMKIYTLYDEGLKDIRLSVAIPAYRAKDIGWLCMEGLCNQKDLDFDWEIVICEERHEQQLGRKFFTEYVKRLSGKRCKKITYIELPKRINLLEKWKIIGRNLDNYKGGLVLQSIDCCSPSQRLAVSHDLINNQHYDWIDFLQGYFYSFEHKELALYNPWEDIPPTNLHIAFKSENVIFLESSNRKTEIDGFMYKTIKESNSNFSSFTYKKLLAGGIDTDGYNNISKRGKYYPNITWPFKEADKKIEDLDLPYSVINAIKPFGVTRVKQIRFSRSVGFFGQRMIGKYNLKEYQNPNEPAIFMGLYRKEDYQDLQDHNSEAIILWCGSDAMTAYKSIDIYNIKSPQYHHIAFGEFVSNDLKELNIPHDVLPITPSSINLSPHKRGDDAYLYSNKKNPKFYGEHFVGEIERRTGLNVIVAYYNSYTFNELLEIYRNCFIGLRLTQHDGLPNTVIEMGLMGRRCLYNGNLPNSIKWDNIDDICESILKEYERRHIDDIKEVHDRMIKHLDIGDGWLYLDYYKKPKVSVMMNSYNENPDYFLQAINSYLAQEDVRVELIVSTVKGDPCIKVCEQYPIKVVISDTPGIWHQLNAGMQVVTGDWVTYASSNDAALPNKLISEVSKCIQDNKEICYSSFYKCDETLSIQKIVKLRDYDYSKHLESNYVSDCALFSKRLLDKYLPFVEEYGNFAYHDFWLRIFEGEGDVFVYSDSPSWFYRVYKDSRHISKQNNHKLVELEEKQKENMIKKHIKMVKK